MHDSIALIHQLLLYACMRQIDHFFYDTPDRPLYHYTGIGTLLGLADVRELWASHVFYMNDAKELAQAYDAIMDYARPPMFVFGGPEAVNFYDQFEAWMRLSFKKPADLFIFSMSEEQSLLSQWRSYTPHGQGVSIQFLPALVQDTATRNQLRLGECIYTRDGHRELIGSLLEKLWTTCRQRELPQQESPEYFSFFDGFQNEIVQVMALIKHEAFAEEREWRLISSVQAEVTKICFRQGEGASILKPYVKFSLSDQPDLFNVVLLGPTPHQDLALHALRVFLNKTRLCNNVHPCEIPYREW